MIDGEAAMREKYISERYPELMVFGQNPETGHVDVATVNCDVVTGLTGEQADTVVRTYNELQSFMVRLALAFEAAAPVQFQAFWYPDDP